MRPGRGKLAWGLPDLAPRRGSPAALREETVGVGAMEKGAGGEPATRSTGTQVSGGGEGGWTAPGVTRRLGQNVWPGQGEREASGLPAIQAPFPLPLDCRGSSPSSPGHPHSPHALRPPPAAQSRRKASRPVPQPAARRPPTPLCFCIFRAHAEGRQQLPGTFGGRSLVSPSYGVRRP